MKPKHFRTLLGLLVLACLIWLIWPEGRSLKDTNERMVKLGWELVEFGKTHPRHYQTFAPGNGQFRPLDWGLWELSKMGDPDTIFVVDPDTLDIRSTADYHLILKKDYELGFKVYYNRNKDYYDIDGFTSNQIGSHHMDYTENWYKFERENPGASQVICSDGVLGYKLGQSTRKDIYRGSYDREFYQWMGIDFRFENDTLSEIKIEHDNQFKTEEGIGFFYYFYDLKKVYGEPESEGVDISYWYPGMGRTDSYNYDNWSFVSNHSYLMFILLRKPGVKAEGTDS